MGSTHLNTDGHQDVDLALNRLVRLGSRVNKRNQLVINRLLDYILLVRLTPAGLLRLLEILRDLQCQLSSAKRSRS